MTERSRYKNVLEMARHLSDDEGDQSDTFVRDLERRLASRNVIKGLMALRATRGLSQKDIAEHMDCTQSRVSKLESGTDEELRMGDLRNYLSAMDLDLTIVVGQKESLIAEQVKYHWACLGNLLGKLVDLASSDAQLATGIGKFATQVAFNYGSRIFDFLHQLPDDAKAEVPDMLILKENVSEDQDSAIVDDMLATEIRGDEAALT